MKNLSFILLLSCLVFISCKDDDDDMTCEDVDYGVTLLVQEGDNFCFPDGFEMRIAALNNEYCPCGAVCVWEGQLTVLTEWTQPDGAVIEHVHNTSDRMLDEPLLDGIEISSDTTTIVFAEICDLANPSPEIVSVEVVIDK